LIDTGDGLPVGQHAAEPAVVDEVLAAARAAWAIGSCAWRLWCRRTAPCTPARTVAATKVERAREQRHGLRQVDDVDAVCASRRCTASSAGSAVGLVAEVRAGLDQLLHGDGG
jgi:hypothetical protein